MEKELRAENVRQAESRKKYHLLVDLKAYRVKKVEGMGESERESDWLMSCSM